MAFQSNKCTHHSSATLIVEVLIVAKTRMKNGFCCVGGLNLNDLTNLRLLTADGNNQRENTSFMVGQIRDMDYTNRSNVIPPHIEDVLVEGSSIVAHIRHLAPFLNRHAPICRESLDLLFNGKLQVTESGSGFISNQAGVPNGSVCFWETPYLLERDNFEARIRYSFRIDERFHHIPFVGYQEAPNVIPSGTLLRMSLARWWRPQDASDGLEERCYMQMSGYYD